MTVTDYTFVTGSLLASPCDIPRVALLVYPNMSMAYSIASGAIENTSDLFSVTLCKYYLNSVVSLSATNAFGGVAHYNNLTTLMSTIDATVDTILNGLYASINTCSKFTDTTLTKYDTLTTTFAGYRSSIVSIQSSVNTLKTAITATRDSLTLTTDIYNTVKTCYTNVITALSGLDSRMTAILSLIDMYTPSFASFKVNAASYIDPDGAQDGDNYMSSMNLAMVNTLQNGNALFSKLYFYKRLRGVIF
ncbi:hypothetical protein ACTA71_011805 [Dictyostelium dimigraforme]